VLVMSLIYVAVNVCGGLPCCYFFLGSHGARGNKNDDALRIQNFRLECYCSTSWYCECEYIPLVLWQARRGWYCGARRSGVGDEAGGEIGDVSDPIPLQE
jgi:hypothetical protein